MVLVITGQKDKKSAPQSIGMKLPTIEPTVRPNMTADFCDIPNNTCYL